MLPPASHGCKPGAAPGGRRMACYTAVMSRVAAIVVILSLALASTASAQARGRTKKPPAKPAPSTLTIAPAQVTCPEPLGKGMRTGVQYCFVPAGTTAEEGVLVKLPARTGAATLIFDLHNRHTYSEQYEKDGRAFARYSAGIGVLTMKMDLVARAAVEGEFRTAADLYERIGGGAGPTGARAVAPLGRERVYITIPAGIDQVSLLGEVLDARTAAGRETATPGRPVALVSNIQIEYRPGRNP
jgi:hypothetical protein